MLVSRIQSVRIYWLASVLLLFVSACGGTDLPDTSVQIEETSLVAVLGGDPLGAPGLASHQEVEALVASCMAASGFEYVPFVPEAALEIATVYTERSQAWVQQWGFGLSTQYLVMEDLMEPNPNEVFRDGLSDPDSQRRYDEAWGRAARSPAGCVGEAVQAHPLTRTMAGFTLQFSDRLREKLDEQASVTDFSPLESEWSNCMSGRGYQYPGVEDAVADFVEATNEIDLQTFGRPVIAHERAPNPDFLPVITEQLSTEIDRLQEREIAVAVADYECNRDLIATYKQAYTAVYDDFLANHRAAIQELTS